MIWRRSMPGLGAALGIVLLLPALRAQESRRPVTIEDSFRIARVGDPRISPDGGWVAYPVATSDLEKDESETAVWMVAAGGGDPIRMTAPGYSASRPRWSPDGRYLSFQASRGESKNQVWVLDRRGGDARPLTEVKQGISAYEWSPQGDRLLLLIRDPDPQEAEDKEKEEGKKKPRPWVIDRLQFKRDNVGYLDRRRTHLYVFEPGDRSLRQITSGDFDDALGAWSPDGKLVAFASNRTENPDGNQNSDIWVVSAGNTDRGKTLLQVTTNPGRDGSPAWSPDGEWIAHTSVIEPGILWYATTHLAVSPAAGGEARVLTRELDRNVSSPRFSADSRAVYFLLEDSAERHLARIELSSGRLSRPLAGPRRVESFHCGAGDEIVLLNSEPHLPAEVFRLRDGEPHQLTRTNQELLDRLALGRVENVHFPSRDGTEIEGFITFPPDFNERLTYPTLLRPHGGPVSQYDFGFHFESQLFAAHGYVVLRPNPRGSSGYGQEFSLGIYQSWGVKDFEDVMAAVDHAIEKGYADPRRLGVGGWSYGGILTNYVITQTDRFKGAISGASEVLYVANYGHDHYQYQWEKELGLPWENRELWERLSPFNYVEKIVTPTLIMCGEKDWNVPVLNSEQLYQALKRLGRTTELVVYPGQHHGIRRPTFQKDRWERYLAWYDRFVKGEQKAKEMPTGERSMK